MGMQASNTHEALASQQSSQGSVNAQMVEQGQNEQFGANLMYTLSAVSLASGAGLFAWDFYGGGASAEEEIPASEDPAEPAAQPQDQPAEDGDLLELGDNTSKADENAREEKDEDEERELF
jgi:hypothetical protein